MGVYLYCLLPEPVAPPPAVRGLDDAAVEVRSCGPLSCWISPLAAVPEPTLERIRRHNAVVAAGLGAGPTPLPVRYGQWLEDEPALGARLREHREAQLRALAHVQGAVEFGVRVLDPALEPEPPLDAAVLTPAAAGAGEAAGATGSGTAYLRALAARAEARRALEARGREIAERLRAALGSIVRDERVEPLRSRHGLIGVAHLVERGGEGDYSAGVAAFGRARDDLRLFVSGPWPPWSFTA